MACCATVACQQDLPIHSSSLNISTVALIVATAIVVAAFNITSEEDGPSHDWKSKDWVTSREKDVDGSTVDWATLGSWEILGYYTSALNAGLWAFGGQDSVRSLTSVCTRGMQEH